MAMIRTHRTEILRGSGGRLHRRRPLRLARVLALPAPATDRCWVRSRRAAGWSDFVDAAAPPAPTAVVSPGLVSNPEPKRKRARSRRRSAAAKETEARRLGTWTADAVAACEGSPGVEAGAGPSVVGRRANASIGVRRIGWMLRTGRATHAEESTLIRAVRLCGACRPGWCLQTTSHRRCRPHRPC